MNNEAVENINIIEWNRLCTPHEIRTEFPLTENVALTVRNGRENIRNILSGQSDKILVVVGPCSIHDPIAAIEYAKRLVRLQTDVQHAFILVMRVYFEKPRTTTGWKGFINDPDLNDTFEIDKGLRKARQLLVEINSIGVPVGTEALDPITPQYIDDLVSWSAIGARTVESQTHREMASGLSSPVGFKNGTDGNTAVMINAIKAASQPHHFLGIDRDGLCSVFQTKGNGFAHAVLRGGGGPNYDSVHIRLVEAEMHAANVRPNIMIDCSHGNSLKKPELQPLVFEDCIKQIVAGNSPIIGLMLESNLNWGNQSLTTDVESLQYGVSITDACIDWETTERILQSAATQLAKSDAS